MAMESSPRLHLDGMLSPTSATRRSQKSETPQRSGEQFGGVTDLDVYTPSSKQSAWNTNGSSSLYRSGSITSRQPTTPTSIPFISPATTPAKLTNTSPLLGHSMIMHNDSTKATESQASMQLLNAVMGAGIVGYPFCFRSCGLLLATLLVLAVVFAAEFSMQLLLLAAHIAGKRSYEEVARYSFGPLGQGLVDFSVSIINLGSLVAYINLASDTFSLVAGTIVPPGAEPSRTAFLIGITLCIALPLCLFVRSPRVLASVSQASVAFLLLFAGVLLVLGVVGPTASSFSNLRWWNSNGVLTAFPVIAYSFTAHQVLFAVYLGLNKPTVQKMTGVVTKTMTAAASVYIAVGIAGYKAFGFRTNGDVLRNLGGGNGSVAEHLVKVGYGMSLIATLPLIILPLQTTFAPAMNRLLRLIHGSSVDVNKDLREGLVTAGVLGIACTIAALVPNVEYIFGLAGSTASVLISFVFPAALFLQVSGTQRGQQGYAVDLARNSPKWRQRRQAAAVLLIFGLVAGVVCTGALLTSIREEAEVVQLAQELYKEERKAADAVATKEEAENIALAVGVVDEARRRLNATREGLGETLLVVEKAEENAAAAAVSTAAAVIAAKGKKTSALTTQQMNNAQKATQKAAAKDLKPALAVAEQAVSELESAAAGLEAALSVKKSSSSASSIENAGLYDDDEIDAHADTRLSIIRAAGLEALQAVRESRLALSEARSELKMQKGGSGGSVGADGDATIETVLRKVATAATAALKKVDETMAALTIAEEEQRVEVAEIVVKLTELNKNKREAESEKANSAAVVDVDVSPRSHVDIPKDKGDTEEGKDLAMTVDTTLDNSNNRETANKLTEDLHTGREVNATLVAQAAADAAEDIIQTAKEAAEQAVGKVKKVDVAVRAIEIAKELAGTTKGSSTSGGTANKVAADDVDGAEAEKNDGSIASSSGFETEEEDKVHGDRNDGDTLLGNLTAVAEAIAGKMDDVAVGAEASTGRKSSRKLDPAG